MTLQLFKLKKDGVNDLEQLFKKNSILSANDPFKNGSIEEFHWQFFSESYEVAEYIYASDPENNELAGTLSALFIKMIGPDTKIHLTIKPEDTLINIKSLIKYKNRDLLKEMFDKICNDTQSRNIKFFWGFTKETNAFKRLGFEYVFSSQQGLYIYDIKKSYNHLISLNHSNKLKQKLQIVALSCFSYFNSYIRILNYKNIYIEEIALKDVDYEKLLSFHPLSLYSIYLDKSFLEWRIEKNPSDLKFSILQFTNKNNKIIAYLIYSKKNDNVFFIEQFLFNQSLNKQEKKKIVNSSLVFFKKNKSSILRVMGFQHNKTNKEEVEILKSVGFVFIKKGIPFIFKTNDKSIKPENIYLSRLNTEGIF